VANKRIAAVSEGLAPGEQNKKNKISWILKYLKGPWPFKQQTSFRAG
jgi:hypothetical protein